MKREPKVKILITYKEKHKVLKSDILVPIQTGRTIASEIFDDMIGDDTGENISKKNPKYSELSAQYWAWKNYNKLDNPDYIGFMHYRRHFIFNEKRYSPNSLGVVEFDGLTDEYINETNLYNNNEIYKKLNDADILVGNKINCRNFTFLSEYSPREAFRWNEDLNVLDYDLMNKIVVSLYPEYEKTIEKIEHGHTQYWYNMFIMKKEYFFEYSKFWYSIISKLEEKIDTSMYGENATRILGYLSERILGIFIFHKMYTTQLKIKELKLSYLKNVNNYDEINPVFKRNFISVVMISSDYFVPYLASALSSIKQNISPSYNYDIVILTRDMSKSNKDKLQLSFSDDNFSIRFLDVIFNESFYSSGHVSVETYIRILIPKMFRKYERVLYLDSDVIVNKDLKYFSTVDFQNKEIAAVNDYTIQSFVNNSKMDVRNYITEILNINDPYSLFNGGVILFNIKSISDDFEQEIIKLLKMRKYKYFDQDPFNIYFKNRVLYLEPMWNFTPLSFFDCSAKCLPKKSKDLLLKAKKDLGIVHFNSNIKPWFDPNTLLAELWWKYTKESPFYIEIIRRMCLVACKSNDNAFINPTKVIKLFNIIPIISIKYKQKKSVYKVLGIPIVKVKHSTYKSKVYLLGIPLCKIINK